MSLRRLMIEDTGCGINWEASHDCNPSSLPLTCCHLYYVQPFPKPPSCRLNCISSVRCRGTQIVYLPDHCLLPCAVIKTSNLIGPNTLRMKTIDRPLRRERLILHHSCSPCVLAIAAITHYASLSLQRVLNPELQAPTLKLVLLAKLPTFYCRVLPSQPNCYRLYEVSCAYLQDFNHDRTCGLLTFLPRRRRQGGSLDPLLPAICFQFCGLGKRRSIYEVVGSHHPIWVVSFQCGCFGGHHTPVSDSLPMLSM